MTTDSKHSLPVAPNLLNREFGAKEPDRVGVKNVDPVSSAATMIYGNAIGDARKLETLQAFDQLASYMDGQLIIQS